MQATVTLTTTTLAQPLSTTERYVNLTSLSGIAVGTCLFVDREFMSIEQITGIGNIVLCQRGIDATIQAPHNQGATVYAGRADQFFIQDPVGMPPNPIPVFPYINVSNGILWSVQGDDVGGGALARTWQPITTAQTIGALGVRIDTVTTPS